jgi:hypothetical protein
MRELANNIAKRREDSSAHLRRRALFDGNPL